MYKFFLRFFVIFVDVLLVKVNYVVRFICKRWRVKILFFSGRDNNINGSMYLFVFIYKLGFYFDSFSWDFFSI